MDNAAITIYALKYILLHLMGNVNLRRCVCYEHTICIGRGTDGLRYSRYLLRYILKPFEKIWSTIFAILQKESEYYSYDSCINIISIFRARNFFSVLIDISYLYYSCSHFNLISHIYQSSFHAIHFFKIIGIVQFAFIGIGLILFQLQ